MLVGWLVLGLVGGALRAPYAARAAATAAARALRSSKKRAALALSTAKWYLGVRFELQAGSARGCGLVLFVRACEARAREEEVGFRFA
jgi:hypothetical protein